MDSGLNTVTLLSFGLNGISTLLILFLIHILNGLRTDLRDIRNEVIKHVSNYNIHSKDTN